MIRGGLFDQAEKAKIETIKGQYRERLSLVAMDEYAAREGEVTRDLIKERIIKERDEGREDWIKEGEGGVKLDKEDTRKIIVTSKEEYVFYVIINENGKIEVIGGEDDGEGDDDASEEIEMPELQEGDILFICTPSTWTNGNVIVTLSTEIEGYDLEYNRTENEEDWESYEEGITYTENGIIYGRLTKEGKVSNRLTGNVNNIDKVKPVVASSSSTTNSLTFTGTDNNGMIGYSVTTSNSVPSNWTEVTSTKTFTQTINSLTQNVTYYIWLKDVAGNSNEVASIKTGALPTLNELEGGNITFEYSPSTWTNGNVTATISTDITGYTLQYSKNGETWTNYTSGVKYTENGIIYARLTDGINVTNVVTGNITNIDRTVPVVTSKSSTTSSVTFTGTDNNGIIGYSITTSNTTPATWATISSTETLTQTLSGLTQNRTYYIWVKDVAGNVNEIASIITGTMPTLVAGDIKFRYTPIGWTSGNVVVTMTTTITGYTIQYSTNNVTWENYVSGVTYTENGIIYARLTDGTNVSNVVTGNITNIDREIPVITRSSSTTNSITFTGVDNNGITGYRVTTTNTVPTSWTSVTSTKLYTQTVSNLTQNVTHYIWVRDVAGNANVVASIVTATMPTLTSGNITFSYNPSTWTSGDVVVTISTNITGYTLQYRKGNSYWTIASGYTGNLTYTENGIVSARLSDGKNYTDIVTGNVENIDKTKPAFETITAAANSVTFTGTDVGSGIVAYGYTTSSTEEPSSWTTVTATTNLTSRTISGLYLNQTYYIWLKDQAGHKISRSINSVQQGDIILTYTATDTSGMNGWTKGNVIVSMSTTVAGSTIQYAKTNPGVEANWINYPSTGVTYTANGTIYARLKYGTGQTSSYITGNVTNIDKRTPTISLNILEKDNSCTSSIHDGTYHLETNSYTYDGSGVYAYYIEIGKKNNQIPTTWTYITPTVTRLTFANRIIPDNENIMIYAKDQAGNMAQTWERSYFDPTSISWEFDEITLETNSSKTLEITTSPMGMNPRYSFYANNYIATSGGSSTSSSGYGATVTHKHTVNAQSTPGTSEITISADNNPAVKDTLIVHVVEPE